MIVVCIHGVTKQLRKLLQIKETKKSNVKRLPRERKRVIKLSTNFQIVKGNNKTQPITLQLGLVDPIMKQIFLPQKKDQITGMTQNHELLEINSQTSL